MQHSVLPGTQRTASRSLWWEHGSHLLVTTGSTQTPQTPRGHGRAAKGDKDAGRLRRGVWERSRGK